MRIHKFHITQHNQNRSFVLTIRATENQIHDFVAILRFYFDFRALVQEGKQTKRVAMTSILRTSVFSIFSLAAR
jgi:hypothetical protein